MERVIIALISVLMVGSLAASPVSATTGKAHQAHHSVTCKQIKDALASGEAADEVAKHLNVSTGRVKQCTVAPSARSHPAAPQHGS